MLNFEVPAGMLLEMERLCRDIRGTEFVTAKGAKAYVAGADPLRGITIKPLDPPDWFLQRDETEQYFWCYKSANCKTAEELLRDLRQKHQLFIGIESATEIVSFEQFTGGTAAVPSFLTFSCPFS